MKSNWKKKLSAFLLALTLIVGLMPTALAADCGHNNWSTWQKSCLLALPAPLPSF